jgi:hypothetical protein
MIDIADLLEQMTWAINQGGPGAGGPEEVYEFLYDVGRVILAVPSPTAPPREPRGNYPPDLLPLIQQMAWASAEDAPVHPVYTFLNTISYYYKLTGPLLREARFKKPTGPNPNIPPALKSLPLSQLPFIFQVAYWMINDGATGNKQAWDFLLAIGHYLSQNLKTTFPGPFQYPY